MDLLKQTLEYCKRDAISPEYAAAIIQHLDNFESVGRVRLWILEHVEKSFNKREAHQRLRGRIKFHRIGELDECFAALERQGFIRKEVRSTGGRPSIWYHRLDTTSNFDPSDIQQLKALL